MTLDTDNTKSRGSTTLIWVALVISALWLFLLALMLLNVDSCGTTGRWLNDAVLCHDIDAIGSFLSGGFAPLAFLWLIVTVVLQSNELRLQRIELQQNRAVSQAQADEARKQAEFIGKQTAIMTEQETRSVEQDRSNEFERTVDAFREWLQQFIAVHLVASGGNRVQGMNSFPLQRSNANSFEVVTAVCRHLETCEDAVHSIKLSNPWIDSFDIIGHRDSVSSGSILIELSDTLYELDGFRHKITNYHQKLYNATRIEPAAYFVSELLRYNAKDESLD